MRRRDGGAGRKVGARQWLLTPAAGARQFRASCWGGARGRDSQPRTRAASGLRPEVLRPPARSWLTATRIASPKARPDAVRKTPQQGAERRAGLRHWPVISGDPEMDPAARRVTRCGASAPAPVGALLPLTFFERSRRQTRGTRPLLNGPAKRWLQRMTGGCPTLARPKGTSMTRRPKSEEQSFVEAMRD